ncbi:hypothetical protein [Methanoregula sp.]|uniref:hypothetical protein n=1 Tax=Methanoregula sp. TaxID=2052170 RepID=UPI000CC2B104|nr:hypothetical protein [Methanoregula sp.]PKG32691.1 MAG: hypothetical protein CW742_06835 [Methanoregula sp.]
MVIIRLSFTVSSSSPATGLTGLFWELVRLALSQGMDSKTMMAKILDEVRMFCGDHPPSDDITLMIIRME